MCGKYFTIKPSLFASISTMLLPSLEILLVVNFSGLLDHTGRNFQIGSAATVLRVIFLVKTWGLMVKTYMDPNCPEIFEKLHQIKN